MKGIAALSCSLVLACASCAGEARADTHVVAIDRMAFQPATLAVHVGDVVEWHNEDAVPHTATSQDAGFDVLLAPGQIERTAITRNGRFDVTCQFHPQMRMRVDANNPE